MKTTDPELEYQIPRNPLKEGGCGSVYKVIRISDKQVFCLKRSFLMQDQNDLKLYQNEFEVLCSTNHPNVVRCFDSFFFESRFFLVLEYAESGDLNSRIGKIKDKKELLNLSFQLIEGIKYLHKKDIIHRAIKPRNILLFKNGAIKIGDFGFAKVVQRSIDWKSKMLGTLPFMAPEMINGDEAKIGNPCDIWSLAVSLYYLIEGKLPFPEFQEIISNPPLPFQSTILPELQTIIFSMLHKDQYMRPTIQQIWNHSLFDNFKVNSFPSVKLDPIKSTRQLIVQTGIISEENIMEISEFPDPEKQEEICARQRNVYWKFQNIYIVQNDLTDTEKINFSDTARSLVVLIPQSVTDIPRNHFSVSYNLHYGVLSNVSCHDLREVFLPPTIKRIAPIVL
jgi:serine/threonine protein kinase